MREADNGDPRQRRLVMQALAAGFFIGGGLPVRSASAEEVFSRLPVKLPAGQSIYRIAGDVRVNGTPADLRTRIFAGDRVDTGRDGDVSFVVGDSAFLLRGNSKLALQPDSADPVLIKGFRLISGAVLSVFGTGRPLALATTTAVIGIRGTGVYIEADPEQTYLCTCYGVAEVAAIDDPQSRDTITSTHHDRPVYILQQGPTAGLIRPAPFVNHTDQELMLIETLAGRSVPFVFPRDDYKAPRRPY